MRYPRRALAIVLLLLGLVICQVALAQEVPRNVGNWPRSFGNHRARVHAAEKAEAVWVHIPWRRRDAQPEEKEIIVVDATTNQRVKNVLRVNIQRESGDLIFQPSTAPGDYYIYYMPYTYTAAHYCPATEYVPPSNTANPEWAKVCDTLAKRTGAGNAAAIPAAKVLEIQAISDFHRFDPMELVATAGEMRDLLAAHGTDRYLLFPEDRRYPIRMSDALPLRWIKAGPSNSFRGEACRGEFYVFQVGVYAVGQNLDNVRIQFAPLSCRDDSIPVAAMRCFNMGGVDQLGRSFANVVNVKKGEVQPLWIGVQVPRDAAAGLYDGAVTIRAQDASESVVKLSLTISEKLLDDAGDSDAWRHSRLRWLDSTIGQDDEVFATCPPIAIVDQGINVFGRRVHYANDGLIDSLQSSFGYSVDNITSLPREILARPVALVVETAAGPLSWIGNKPRVVSQSSGAVTWETTSTADGITLQCLATMECDGYIHYRLTLRSAQPTQLKDIRLEIPVRREVAVYMMGLGRKGGRRPAQWTWDPNVSDNMLWIGDVNAGLFYRGWGKKKQGQGGCTVTEHGDQVVVSNYTGPRDIAGGGEMHLDFDLLVTPTKTLNKDHWKWRYYQTYPEAPVPAEGAANRATIVTVHHGSDVNPYINYPFITVDKLAAYAKDVHAWGMKFKFYYTKGELSCYATEFWALRSLKDEILQDGLGFRKVAVPKTLMEQHYWNADWSPYMTGHSWLAEHVIKNYAPAWHQPLANGEYDGAVGLVERSRWSNYYLEGLAWLCRNVGMDGLYLDGMACDRNALKRVRKVLDRTRPGCLLDLHGAEGSAIKVMDRISMIDSLWFGERFDYNETPDYWLLEVSGIPYGLFGEMLQGGGNPWRGMLYGITARLGWQEGKPQAIWKVWDEFGIQDARMIGYWDPACPVKTGRKDVLATVYVKQGRTLVAVASWAKEPVKCNLAIDWKALGLDATKARLSADKVTDFQTAADFHPNDDIPIQPGRGWLLVLHE